MPDLVCKLKGEYVARRVAESTQEFGQERAGGHFERGERSLLKSLRP